MRVPTLPASGRAGGANRADAGKALRLGHALGGSQVHEHLGHPTAKILSGPQSGGLLTVPAK